jgi:hypothetical protein
MWGDEQRQQPCIRMATYLGSKPVFGVGCGKAGRFGFESKVMHYQPFTDERQCSSVLMQRASWAFAIARERLLADRFFSLHPKFPVINGGSTASSTR